MVSAVRVLREVIDVYLAIYGRGLGQGVIISLLIGHPNEFKAGRVRAAADRAAQRTFFSEYKSRDPLCKTKVRLSVDQVHYNY